MYIPSKRYFFKNIRKCKKLMRELLVAIRLRLEEQRKLIKQLMCILYIHRSSWFLFWNFNNKSPIPFFALQHIMSYRLRFDPTHSLFQLIFLYIGLVLFVVSVVYIYIFKTWELHKEQNRFNHEHHSGFTWHAGLKDIILIFLLICLMVMD